MALTNERMSALERRVAYLESLLGVESPPSASTSASSAAAAAPTVSHPTTTVRIRDRVAYVVNPYNDREKAMATSVLDTLRALYPTINFEPIDIRDARAFERTLFVTRFDSVRIPMGSSMREALAKRSQDGRIQPVQIVSGYHPTNILSQQYEDYTDGVGAVANVNQPPHTGFWIGIDDKRTTRPLRELEKIVFDQFLLPSAK